MNVNMSTHTASKIDQPWTDLQNVLGASPNSSTDVSRNKLAASLLQATAHTMQQFAEQGFDQFASQWQDYDICLNQPVELTIGNNTIQGIARGIDAQGQLLVESQQQIKPYSSGEVSLRLAQ